MSDDLSIPSPAYRAARRSQGMDPATKRLAVIAGGLGGVLLLVVGGWSTMGHRSTAVPVVQADGRPVRVKPENPGGMQIAGANEDIFSTGSGTNGGKLAPPPEAPAPQALRAPLPPAAPPVAAPTPAPVATGTAVPVKPVGSTPLPATKPAAVTASAAPKPVAENAVSPDSPQGDGQARGRRTASACWRKRQGARNWLRYRRKTRPRPNGKGLKAAA